jgi:hypothetical protein
MKYHAFYNFKNYNARSKKTFFVATSPWLRRAFCVALFLVAICSSFAESLSLGWDTNPESNIAGYRLRYGTVSGNYTITKEVGNSTTITLPDLVAGTTYYFSVSAYNTDGLEGPSSEEVSATIEPVDADGDDLPDAWEMEQGIAQLDNSTGGGAMGDPDRDGLPNLVEYAMNLNPTSPQAVAPTSTSIQVNPADGKSYLAFTYQRRVSAPGVLFVVEATDNLVNWSAEPERFEEIGSPAISIDGASEVVSVRVKPAVGEVGAANMVRLRIKKGL